MAFPRAFLTVRKAFEGRQRARRALSAQAGEALPLAKRAIFALHRGDRPGALALLAEGALYLAEAAKLIKSHPDLDGEGSYRAALEETAEARLFLGYVEHGTLGGLDRRLMAPDIYLGGLSDATGEIVRLALRQATDGDTKSVQHAHQVVEEAIAFLYELDLTGNLRSKFDQAKKNLRALEQLRYDLRPRA